jgi:hypothetical protein
MARRAGSRLAGNVRLGGSSRRRGVCGSDVVRVRSGEIDRLELTPALTRRKVSDDAERPHRMHKYTKEFKPAAVRLSRTSGLRL